MTCTMKKTVWMILCAVVLAAPAALAQQNDQSQQNNQSQQNDQAQPQTGQQPNGQQQNGQPQAGQPSAPIPAYRSPFAAAADNGDDDEAPPQLAPDTQALSGAQNLSLGTPTRSYWQPHFDFSTTADSNPQETANSPGWGAWTSISGGVDVHRTSGSNDLTLGYASGGVFSTYRGVGDGVAQNLIFGDRIGFHRSTLSFFDNLNYLPEAQLGFGNLAGNTLPGTATGLGPVFGSGQSLLTGYGQNLANAFATELDTFLTPRTSLTFVGGYSLLHYFDSDLLNYNNVNFRGGYNYQVTRKDTIALLYTFSGFRYGNASQSINDNAVQVSYGRRTTGRLAFQVAVGPQIVTSRISLTGAGSSGGATPTATNTVQFFWALNTSVQWQAQRTLLGAAYSHGVGGGSGLLAGSVSDVATGSVRGQVTRTFSNGFFGGYSRSKGVDVLNMTPSSQTYNYWFAGTSLSRPVGRTLGLTFSYQLQYQTSNSTFCIGTTCGTNVLRHLISVGVGWHERPILF